MKVTDIYTSPTESVTDTSPTSDTSVTSPSTTDIAGSTEFTTDSNETPSEGRTVVIFQTYTYDNMLRKRTH